MAIDGKIDHIQIQYQKARHHRTFHADGAWAAITPQLEVQVSLFSDLQPLPDDVVYRIGPGGKLGGEIPPPKTTPFYVRETDVTVVMNKEVVNNLIELLQRMVRQIDQHLEQTQSPKDGGEKEPSKV
jgi:hypothetical protein